MSAPIVQECDVAVLGAGPAGAACVLALARAGVDRVCLVDSGAAPAANLPTIGETIPPDARTLLDRLGLWGAFLKEGHEPCLGSCSSWGSETLGFNDFVLNPYGHGWHLDRARFDEFLRLRALATGVKQLKGARFLEASADEEGGYRLTISTRAGDSCPLNARYVVDATGRVSAFARSVGARQEPLDRLTFVCGYFDGTGASSRSCLTLLEAAQKGWWYAAALPGKRLAVALATDADLVRAGRFAQEGAWLAAALGTRHLAARLQGCRFLPGSITARVSASFLLDKVAGPRWLAAGDSAASFDPLAAQGIHKALADGLAAAELIAAAIRRGGDLMDDYAIAARARFDEYLVNRNYFYNLEQRWPDCPFWQRRQSRTALMAAA